jgi:CheY-like chemotaxis protein
MNNLLPVFRYPTTTVIVDDDKIFLKTIAQGIRNKNLVRTFNRPNDVLEYINKHSNFEALAGQYLKILDSEDINEVRIAIEYGKIHNELNNDQKQDVISTIIIDYDMPEIDGLSMCRELSNNFFKVLLTSAVTDAKVIEAFNSKIIDAYIPKNSPDLISAIRKVIDQAEESYFNKLSSPIVQALTLHPNSPCYFTNSSYIKFFNDLINMLAITEYYLVEPMGSCILTTKNGVIYNLFVSDEDELIATIESIPDNTDPKMIEMLKRRELMVCYPFDNKVTLSSDNIYLYVHECKNIKDSKLYYSLVES